MSALATEIPAGTWELDPVHSSAGFAVTHQGISTFRGRFEDFDATLTVADGQPRVTGVVKADSIVVKDDGLAAHLRSPEFFDTERHPEVRFESVAFRADGDELVVDGDLTIRDTTRRVEARGKLTQGPQVPPLGPKYGVQLEAIVDRREFGLDWQMELPGGGDALGWEVKLIVELEFKKAE